MIFGSVSFWLDLISDERRRPPKFHCFAASAHADVRMYTGSLVIHAFGNDTTTGSVPPYDMFTYFGIPLTEQCDTNLYHAKETLTFPTTPTGRYGLSAQRTGPSRISRRFTISGVRGFVSSCEGKTRGSPSDAAPRVG